MSVTVPLLSHIVGTIEYIDMYQTFRTIISIRFSKPLLVYIRVGVKYSTCTWYLYLSTYLSVLDVLEYLVYGNVKVLVLVLDQKVLGT